VTRRSPRAKRPRCKLCKGNRKVVQERRHGLFGLIDRKVVVCPECGGTGLPKPEPGAGFSRRQREMRAALGLDPNMTRAEVQAQQQAEESA